VLILDRFTIVTALYPLSIVVTNFSFILTVLIRRQQTKS
jgi:hypothetical protein